MDEQEEDSDREPDGGIFNAAMLRVLRL